MLFWTGFMPASMRGGGQKNWSSERRHGVRIKLDAGEGARVTKFKQSLLKPNNDMT